LERRRKGNQKAFPGVKVNTIEEDKISRVGSRARFAKGEKRPSS
jgi:hypothetical protein